MGALYVKLIKRLLMLIVFYGAPALFVTIKLSDYFNCDASKNNLICTAIVIIAIVVLVLLMRVFVYPVFNEIETIKNDSKR